MSINTTSNRGFTLIELLVVVAIVGVLATAGIPQYRRMVAKAKQVEAKVALGEVATAQASFQSEHGAYGTNLKFMGVQSDIANASGLVVARMVASKTYMYGFLQPDCGPTLAAPRPLPADPAGDELQDKFPCYYNTGDALCYNATIDAAGTQSISSVAFGRTTRIDGCSNGAISGMIIPASPLYLSYRVIASGIIRPGVDKDAGVGADADLWSVNEERLIRNTQTGMD